jgi:hypothetical protein
MSRIDSNRAAYESWPIEMQEAVLHQRAVAGMTPEMVEMALGKPAEIQSRAGKDGPEDVWIYKKSSMQLPSILQNTGVSVGTNIGGVGVSSGTSGRRGGSRASEDPENQEIVFRNGIVLRGSS